MMNEARETGSKEFDLSGFDDNRLFIMEDVLHEEMIELFDESAKDLNFVLGIMLMTLLMPINYINKLIFSRMTRINFKTTVSDYLDFSIVFLAVFIYIAVFEFESEDLKYPLFSPEED